MCSDPLARIDLNYVITYPTHHYDPQPCDLIPLTQHCDPQPCDPTPLTITVTPTMVSISL